MRASWSYGMPLRVCFLMLLWQRDILTLGVLHGFDTNMKDRNTVRIILSCNYVVQFGSPINWYVWSAPSLFLHRWGAKHVPHKLRRSTDVHQDVL